MKSVCLSTLLLFAAITQAAAGGNGSVTADSTKHTSSDRRNVMLNAESASTPREINIGLPSSGGATIFMDGFFHAHGVPSGPHHWAGPNASEPVGTIGLMESVLWAGEYGHMVDSRTRWGGDSLSGAFTGASSNNGLVRMDAALNGPLGTRGWHFALGAYVNYDPTSVHSPSRLFVEQKQVYQAALTRRWRSGGSLSVLYRFSLCGDNSGDLYSVAPFVYNGDGSIALLDGFRLGRDCYVPADETVRWMDLASGEVRTGDMSRLDERRLHDLFVIYNRRTDSGWDLEAGAHLCRMSPSQSVHVSLAGIDRVAAAQGFTLPGGGAFEGLLQNRLAVLYDEHTLDGDLRLKAERDFGRHRLHLGINAILCSQYEAGSSFLFAHTVGAGPERVFRDGASTWGFNTNACYYDAIKSKLALYCTDDWRPLDRLLLRTGVRAVPLYYDVHSAARLEGETLNTRVDGFNLADPSLATLHHFRRPGMDYVLSEHVSWRLSPRMSAMSEGFYSMTEKSTSYFQNATLPSLKAIGNALVRGGLTFDHPSMDVTALVSYITSWNNAAAVSVTKQIGGVSETQLYTAQYGIGTLGFTLDGNYHAGGFNLHALATWQDPQYHNYRNVFTFSDGSQEEMDYTGNTVTGISRLMVEFDPSYRWRQLRLWGSLRYCSRQYVSRTNLAWFDGHFETFAGADWDFATRHRISMNLVNLLMQSGAKGSIDIADTIDDPSALRGYVMAGSYIRPFTVDLAYTYKF